MLRYNRWSHLTCCSKELTCCSKELFSTLSRLFWSSTLRMARIYPFRALRYNPAIVRLEDVVTQPYDKITPSMQQSYYQRSPLQPRPLSSSGYLNCLTRQRVKTSTAGRQGILPSGAGREF